MFCAFVLCPLGATPAQANRDSNSADRAVEYLQADQNLDGGFGGSPGSESSSGFTAWVSIALAAAGINPKIQKKPGGTDAYTYLLAHAGEMSFTTDFERELLVVDAANTSPHDFAGIDLITRILEREIPESAEEGVAFPHETGSSRAGMNDTIFAVLALSAIHEPLVETAVQQARTWIEYEQNADGSWPSTCPRTVAGCSPLGKEPQGESDMTAAAIEALNAAGHHDTEAQAKGLEFLHTMQVPAEGGFIERPGEAEANVGSTAWVAQGLWAAGVNPEDWKPGGIDPLAYIESMQQPDGHVKWRRKADLNGVWMTAYAGPALFGDPLPVTPTSINAPIPAPTSPGSGGEGSQSGDGVDAGGGGKGAPLFSRPQPQSTGHTPGGVQALASKAARAKRTRHRRNPGPPRPRPAPAIGREADHDERAPRPAATDGERLKGTAGKTGTGATSAAKARLAVPAATGTSRNRQEVEGIPIGSTGRGDLEPGAPGLHAAGQRPDSPTLAIAVAAAAVLLALAGAALEQGRLWVTP